MALFIQGRDKEGKDITRQWHVGEPLPQDIYGPVVTYQADGHELFFLQDAMKLRAHFHPYTPIKEVERVSELFDLSYVYGGDPAVEHPKECNCKRCNE